MRSEPVRARFRLKVSRLSRRIKASRQAARPGRAARVAEMELRYETLTIPAPLKTPAGVDPAPLTVVHAREIRAPAKGKRLEWFLLTTLPVKDAEQARRVLSWYALRWRVEDYFRVLKTGCRVQQLQHQTADRLKRAIAIHAVIAWRIMLMTLLGREDPDLPAQLLFSDLEIRVLDAFAASRGYPPPEDLGAAVAGAGSSGGISGPQTRPSTRASTDVAGLRHALRHVSGLRPTGRKVNAIRTRLMGPAHDVGKGQR